VGGREERNHHQDHRRKETQNGNGLENIQNRNQETGTQAGEGRGQAIGIGKGQREEVRQEKPDKGVEDIPRKVPEILPGNHRNSRGGASGKEENHPRKDHKSEERRPEKGKAAKEGGGHEKTRPGNGLA